jgi:hypothetical protein
MGDLPERLDRGVSPAEAERALRDLERVYRLFLAGGRDLRRLVLRELTSAPTSCATPAAKGAR